MHKPPTWSRIKNPVHQGETIDSYLHRLRALSPDAKRYLASTPFRAASLGIWSLLFNLWLASLGFDTPLIGLLNTLLSAASTLCALPAGLIADRIGRKRAMVAGLAGIALCRLGVSLSTRGWTIATWTALLGMMAPLFAASAAPFLVESSTPRQRALLFTFDAGLMNLSTFVATTAGGYLPRAFAALLQIGVESAPAYRGAMLVATAITALGLVPILPPHDAPRSTSSRRPKGHPSRRFWQRFSDPRLLLQLTGPRVLLAFAAGLVFPFLNLFFKERFGISDATLGWVFGITELVAGMIMLGSDGVVQRLGKIRTMLVSRAISTPMLLIIGFVPSLPVVVIAHWIRSGLMRLGGPLYMAFAMENLDEGERATGSSLLGMSWDVGWSTGPAVSGLAQPYVGFGPLFVSMVVLYGTSLALTYRFFGRREQSKHP